MGEVVTFSEVESAHRVLDGVVNRTPVLRSRTLDEKLGCELFLKAECFQRTGSFKFRGAYHAVSKLSEDEKTRGVITYSSGNHAQGLALACRLQGVAVTVIMPTDAPEMKKRATEGYGAEVILYDRDETTREALGAEMAAERGLTIIPPYDHVDIVAGQGTAVKELIEEVGELDLLLVCVGGGGLLSGSALSARALSPGCRVVGVEPEAGDDIKRSMEAGEIVSVRDPVTIADGARTPSCSELTFGLIRENVDEIVTVNDRVLLEVTRFYFERMKVVVEPTGALSLGALWSGAVSVEKGARVGVVITGGNVDVPYLVDLWSQNGVDSL